MRILITNDDGINADGIIRLAKAAKELGEVWIVAPLDQRSAASHSISLHNYIDVYPYDFPIEGVKAFSCSGTPADCIRVGCLNIMPYKPDLVLSGLNNGYNVASDIQYSATAGAAFEGSFQGIASIALSEEADKLHEVSDRYLPEILTDLANKKLGYGQIFNVNFPGCPLNECNGILTDRRVSHGMFFRDHYIELAHLENNGVRLMVEGDYNEDTEPDTDFRAVVDKYISISIVKNIG
ncbi:MAG: 5'/3'-nucleotidase SurE [Ruminococcus sp.]|uniref:5'/3'-nucleotidase SurE n=1 Tax=Ruminococcus sp. TaxID=41978 RepID=UPI0025F0A0EC|nr:5'/3'-nucleotidase SurE [Ruminococcus sp.]MCR4795204.1 5'/3'-nucleotidase SurE [Ruminococcus sp.]